VSQNRITN